MNSFPHDGRQPVDFVCLRPGVKRISLEEHPCGPRGFLLRVWQGIERLPECYRGKESRILRPARQGFRQGGFHVHKPPVLRILDTAPDILRNVRVFHPADQPFNRPGPCGGGLIIWIQLRGPLRPPRTDGTISPISPKGLQKESSPRTIISIGANASFPNRRCAEIAFLRPPTFQTECVAR